MGRVFPGIAMAAGWILLLFLAPPLLFWFCIVLAALTGLTEYCRMTGVVFPGPCRFLFPALSLLPVLASLTGQVLGVSAGLFGGLLGIILLILCTYSRLDDVLYSLALGMTGMLYVSFCAAHVVLIRHLGEGVSWLVILTAITAASDTGAYYSGRAFGRRKLCPTISPGKTVAGAVGGLLAGTSAAVLAGVILLPEVSSVRIGLVASLLVVFGIVGDLTESVIKRATGFKDSGMILAGHGGLLDRVDSLLLTAPALYYLLVSGLLV